VNRHVCHHSRPAFDIKSARLKATSIDNVEAERSDLIAVLGAKSLKSTERCAPAADSTAARVING
jgi:hypothetical protein